MKPSDKTPGPRLVTALLAAGLAAACVETRTEGPASGPPDVVVSTPAATFEASAVGRTVGRVIRFEPTDPTVGPWFSVRDAYDRELGMIDAVGRAWRYRPHQLESELLGAGTVNQGVARILGEAAVELAETPPH